MELVIGCAFIRIEVGTFLGFAQRGVDIMKPNRGGHHMELITCYGVGNRVCSY